MTTFPSLSKFVEEMPMNASEHAINIKQLRSFYSSAIFGNNKMFKSRWRQETAITNPEYFVPQKL